MKKSYYAIIPANVRYDKSLIDGAKLLYGEITALCNEKGYCWATNGYFADLYGVSKVTISKWINQLVKSGYVTAELHYKEGSKEILNRYIRIVNDPIKEKINTPIKEKFKDNNTVINNTSNNTKKKHPYAENVTLTKDEHQKLLDEFGEEETANKIEKLSLYKGSSGRNYKSDYMTILSWDRRDKEKAKPKPKLDWSEFNVE